MKKIITKSNSTEKEFKNREKFYELFENSPIPKKRDFK